MVGVERLELAELLRLAREGLRHHHPLERLLQERVEPGQPRPHDPVGVPRADAEVRGDREQDRHHRERDDGEAPVHPEHDDDDARQRHHVAEDRHQAAREHLAHGLDVVEDAGHEPAHGVPVEEARVEALEVPEEHAPEVVHHALAGDVGDVTLDGAQAVERREREEEEEGDPAETWPVRLEDVVVDGDLDQVGLHQLDAGDEGEEHGRGQDQAPLGPRRRPQAPDEALVVGAAEDLVVLGLARHGRSRPRAAARARAARRRRRGRAAPRGPPARRRGRPRARRYGRPPPPPAAGA